ncbi:hypothetical protein BHM03_00025369 [Ensete ventricosum]|nr:hypothetical protein BHM03_00025369 [Ensete ventricosum]
MLVVTVKPTILGSISQFGWSLNRVGQLEQPLLSDFEEDLHPGGIQGRQRWPQGGRFGSVEPPSRVPRCLPLGLLRMGPLVVFALPGHQCLSRDILVHLLEHLEDYCCWVGRAPCPWDAMLERQALGFPTRDDLHTLYGHRLTYKDQIDATPFGVIRSRWLKKSTIEPQGRRLMWRITLALRLLAGPLWLMTWYERRLKLCWSALFCIVHPFLLLPKSWFMVFSGFSIQDKKHCPNISSISGDNAMGARREFAGGWPRFGRCCRELAKKSLEVCREVRREFVDRLSGARRVFVGRMLEVRWEFAEGNPELV